MLRIKKKGDAEPPPRSPARPLADVGLKQNYFNIDRLAYFVALLLFLAYATEMTAGGTLFKLSLGALSTLGIFLCLARMQTVFIWLGFLSFLGYLVVVKPFILANHHYVMMFVCGIMIIWHIADKDERIELVATNARLLAAVIMLMATFQKIFSPTYLSGNYIGFMWAKGSYFAPITQRLFSNYEETVRRNLERIVAFRQTMPSSILSIELEPPSEYYGLFVSLTVWLIIVTEGVAAALLITARNLQITYWFTTVLTLSIAMARQELTFLSCFCFLLALASGRRFPIIENVLFTIAVLLVIFQVTATFRH